MKIHFKEVFHISISNFLMLNIIMWICNAHEAVFSTLITYFLSVWGFHGSESRSKTADWRETVETKGEKTETLFISFFWNQGFKDHQLHDVLASPGSSDLTADVDFSYLRRVAGGGVACLGPVTQTTFLKNMGIDTRLQVSLTIFSVITGGVKMAATVMSNFFLLSRLLNINLLMISSQGHTVRQNRYLNIKLLMLLYYIIIMCHKSLI